MLQRGEVIQQSILVKEDIEQTLTRNLVRSVDRPLETHDVAVLQS